MSYFSHVPPVPERSERRQHHQQYHHDGHGNISYHPLSQAANFEMGPTEYTSYGDPNGNGPGGNNTLETPPFATWSNPTLGTPGSGAPLLSSTSRTPPTAANASPEERPQVLKNTRTNTAGMLRHMFRRREQFRKHFMGVAGRFLLSVGFCAAIIGLFMLYERRGVLDRDARHIFNAAYLGLSLVLGLNLVSSFKAMADIFRWKVLASGRHGGHTAKELDLILGMNSYQKCTVLLWHWIKKPLYFSLLFGWIILGIGIQLSVALLGLTYNHESEDAQRTSPGLVNATDIRWFYSPPRVDGGDNHIPSFLEQNHRSHVFGEVADVLLKTGNRETARDILRIDPEELDIIETTVPGSVSKEYKYHFRESVWQPDGKPLITQTKRYITAKSSCTHSYIVTAANGDGIVTLDPSPSVDFYSYLLGNSSDDSNSSYTAPYEWLATWQAFGTTLYSNPSLNRNASERATDREGEGGFPNVPCGPRCGYIEVFRFTRGKEWDDKNSRGDYFLCTTEVSTVFGATQKEHELPDMMAVRAASAIGSSAVYDGNSGAQVSVYNDANRWDRWEVTGPAASSIAESYIARFAIGALAIADRTNPPIEIQGDRPWRGVLLVVNWRNVWLTLAVILFTQACVALAVIIRSNDVYCRDDSYLSLARLLRGVVDRMGQKGSAATGKEIWRWFGKRRLRYAVDPDGTKLDILVDEPLQEMAEVSGGMQSQRYYD